MTFYHKCLSRGCEFGHCPVPARCCRGVPNPSGSAGPSVPQPLKVRLELETDLPREDLPGLYDRMMTDFKKKTSIASALEWVEPETLFREMKRTRFIEII
jgi:hypothetical protein